MAKRTAKHRPQQRGQTVEVAPLPLEAHRRQFAEFVSENAQGPFAPLLRRLYELSFSWNAEYFGGRLVWPHILLAEPKSSRAWGDYCTLSGWGSRGQVRVRPSLFLGTHPAVQSGDQYAEGRIRVVEDVSLHEHIHLYNDEIERAPEDSYHGHGPVFRDRCNDIGRRLGLPPVGTKRQGLPLCNQWPHNVRPPGYYLGALVPEIGSDDNDTADEEKAEGFSAHFARAHTLLEQAAAELYSALTKAASEGADIAELLVDWDGRLFPINPGNDCLGYLLATVEHNDVPIDGDDQDDED